MGIGSIHTHSSIIHNVIGDISTVMALEPKGYIGST